MSRRIAVVRHERPIALEQEAMVSRMVAELGGQLVPEAEAAEADVVLVLGGDGTILRATELVRGHPIPILGVNFGHVGFLAEAEPESLGDVVSRLVRGEFTVERRMTLELQLTTPDGQRHAGWALNEIALLKMDRARMIDVAIGVDGRAVSSFGCDGLLMATPTGSTAYAFSAGGPIVWPDVEAILTVPIAAHALFARPFVVGPASEVTVHVGASFASDSEIACDGRRILAAPGGSMLTVRRSSEPVALARLHDVPFSGRLVAKFTLPVTGWRTASSRA